MRNGAIFGHFSALIFPSFFSREYKAPKSASGSAVINDYATVLHEVIKDRGYERQKIGLNYIHEKLDQIANLNGMKKPVNEVLGFLFKVAGIFDHRITELSILYQF